MIQTLLLMIRCIYFIFKKIRGFFAVKSYILKVSINSAHDKIHILTLRRQTSAVFFSPIEKLISTHLISLEAMNPLRVKSLWMPNEIKFLTVTSAIIISMNFMTLHRINCQCATHRETVEMIHFFNWNQAWSDFLSHLPEHVQTDTYAASAFPSGRRPLFANSSFIAT